MKIDYEKKFKKLVEQINFWYRLAIRSQEVDERLYPGKMTKFNEGMVFAYGSIERLANKLSDGSFEFDETEGRETVIIDRRGFYCNAYLCDIGDPGCPYRMNDIDGKDACYQTTYTDVCPYHH